MKSKQAFFTALGGRVRFTRGDYNITSDPVWLAAFAAGAGRVRTVLDVGVGTGGAALCLMEHLPGARVTGIDTSESMLAECKQNAALNGRELELIHADILNWRTARTFDIVMTNPPYFKGTPRVGANVNSPCQGTDTTRANLHSPLHNIHHNINLYDWVRACLKRVRPRGRFYCIIDASAAAEVIAALHDGRAGEVTIIPLFGHVGANVNSPCQSTDTVRANSHSPLQKHTSAERVLISARPGARGGTKITTGLSMNDDRVLRARAAIRITGDGGLDITPVGAV